MTTEELLAGSLRSSRPPFRPKTYDCPRGKPPAEFPGLANPHACAGMWGLNRDVPAYWMHTDDVLDDVILGVYDQANENDGCPTMHDSLHAPAGAGLGNEAKHELDVLTGRALENAHEAKSAAFAFGRTEPAALNANTGQECPDFKTCACENADGGAGGKDFCLCVESTMTPLQTHDTASNIQEPRPPIKMPTSGSSFRPPTCLLTFSRRILSEMSLRLLNIPKAMHKGLDLVSAYPIVGRRRSSRCTVFVRIPGGWAHPVTMTCASGSHHRRLTEGWAVVCRVAKIRVGDAVHFSRTKRHDTLEMTITRAGKSACQ